MSRQYQDPRYQPADSPYQPSPNPPRQSEQHYSTTQDGYSTHQNQHAYPATTYQEGRQQPQSAHSGSYPPYAEDQVPFPEPYAESSSRQRSATGHPATYAALSTLPQPAVGTYHQDHQESYGYHPSGGTSSSSHPTYPTSGSVANSVGLYARSEVSGSAYNTGTSTQPDTQNWDDTGANEGHDGPDFRPKGPHSSPVASHRPKCRYPGCNNYVFFDRRVNELREWCSDEHMGAAIQRGVEKPCRHCGAWPRRYGYKYCSGDVCRCPYPR